MADDRVVPIGEVQRAVGGHLQVGGTEVWIAGIDDWLLLDRREARAVIGDLVAENALKADDVGYEQVALHLGWEMAAAQILKARARAGALLIDLRRLGMFG